MDTLSTKTNATCKGGYNNGYGYILRIIDIFSRKIGVIQ